jgi:hypothetical protein
MTAKIYVEPEAEAELEEAAERYEDGVPGLGREFLAEMRRRTDEVAEAPHRFPPFGAIEGVQCAHATGRFPHLVVYMQHDGVVHVLAYMHPRRRPGYWVGRVRKP